MNNQEKIKVIFIASQNRSVSTLLDLLLGQLDGFISVGEMKKILDGNFSEQQLCGCGKTFQECEFWQSIFQDVFDDDFTQKDMVKMSRSTERIRYIPWLVYNQLRTSEYKDKLKIYSKRVINLFKAIQKKSGAKIIVDSSKTPSYGFAMNSIEDIDLYVVHLVRDSRAVAYSMQKSKLRPEILWQKQYLPKYSLLKSSLSWNFRNLSFQTLGFISCNYLRIRYEDLTNDIENTIAKILSLIGEDISNNKINDELNMNNLTHTVCGNPMRFKKGKIKIRPDLEWQTNMNKWKKYSVTALTCPFLWKYGYFEND